MMTSLFVAMMLAGFIYGLLFMPDDASDFHDFILWVWMIVGSIGTALCIVYHVYKLALI